MKKLKIWGILHSDYQKGMDLERYNDSAGKAEKEVLFIQSGNTKGTTFKIKVNDHVFSSLFDTGAQGNCIKYDTAAALGLLHQISKSTM